MLGGYPWSLWAIRYIYAIYPTLALGIKRASERVLSTARTHTHTRTAHSHRTLTPHTHTHTHTAPHRITPHRTASQTLIIVYINHQIIYKPSLLSTNVGFIIYIYIYIYIYTYVFDSFWYFFFKYVWYWLTHFWKNMNISENLPEFMKNNLY